MLKKSLLSIIFLILLITNLFSSKGIRTKQPGDQVNDFTLTSTDGSSYTLSNMKTSKAVVVIFWSTKCPYVKSYSERVTNIYKEFSSKGIVFWAINSNSTEPFNDVAADASRNNYPFPMLKDVNNVVADNFEATKTPEVFVLDPSNITIIYHGRIDDNINPKKVTVNNLSNVLDELLEGKDISVKSTKSFGCMIRRIN